MPAGSCAVLKTEAAAEAAAKTAPGEASAAASEKNMQMKRIENE